MVPTTLMIVDYATSYAPVTICVKEILVSMHERAKVRVQFLQVLI